MTPTLFDVYEILGLAVDGEPVTCRPISDFREFIENNLGIVPTGSNLTVINHLWLKANFRELPLDATPMEVVRYTQVYLLFLIIVTIFADASVATVPRGTCKSLKILRKLADILGVLQPSHFCIVPLEKLVLSSKDILVVQPLLCR
ncbi:hypothetical protein AMTR_s00043p00212190 [Amborella trichopoda]|uniref:Aminotransferase-like plant mobile domain-containing protein n=1 Tax=Amborella trichopoda TaxID=13333 RepID=W1PXQ9_AMBTC|nr:hypothetical protein AMTR_s00043p00212190 [Amborella trichopoda]